jgi:hypothetical protein
MSIIDAYDPVDSNLWASLTLAWCRNAKDTNWTDGRPDIVFTSESYGETWSAALGCKHACIDQARVTIPISGTMVRSRPIQESLDFLPECVREYYLQQQQQQQQQQDTQEQASNA